MARSNAFTSGKLYVAKMLYKNWCGCGWANTNFCPFRFWVHNNQKLLSLKRTCVINMYTLPIFSLAPPKDVELLLGDNFELMSKQSKTVRMFQYLYPLMITTRSSLPIVSSLLFRCACNATIPVQLTAENTIPESMVYSVTNLKSLPNE